MRSSKPFINISKKVKDFNAAMKLLFNVVSIDPLGSILCIFYYFFPSCYFIFDFISRYNLISFISLLLFSVFIILVFAQFVVLCLSVYLLAQAHVFFFFFFFFFFF